MVISVPLMLDEALVVSIWRRLNRVVVEYPGGTMARWTLPYSGDINAIAFACAFKGMKTSGARGCMERWTR